MALAVREKRLLRYFSIGISTFGIDLSLLWIFIDVFRFQYLLATAAAFLLAVSLNYVLSRAWVFRHSERAVGQGYLYFLQFALIGAGVTTALMWLLTNYTEIQFAVARIIIAAIVGAGNYLANLHFNFKVAEKPLE